MQNACFFVRCRTVFFLCLPAKNKIKIQSQIQFKIHYHVVFSFTDLETEKEENNCSGVWQQQNRWKRLSEDIRRNRIANSNEFNHFGILVCNNQTRKGKGRNMHHLHVMSSIITWDKNNQNVLNNVLRTHTHYCALIRPLAILSQCDIERDNNT